MLFSDGLAQLPLLQPAAGQWCEANQRAGSIVKSRNVQVKVPVISEPGSLKPSQMLRPGIVHQVPQAASRTSRDSQPVQVRRDCRRAQRPQPRLRQLNSRKRYLGAQVLQGNLSIDALSQQRVVVNVESRLLDDGRRLLSIQIEKADAEVFQGMNQNVIAMANRIEM